MGTGEAHGLLELFWQSLNIFFSNTLMTYSCATGLQVVAVHLDDDMQFRNTLKVVDSLLMTCLVLIPLALMYLAWHILSY